MSTRSKNRKQSQNYYWGFQNNSYRNRQKSRQEIDRSKEHNIIVQLDLIKFRLIFKLKYFIQLQNICSIQVRMVHSPK